MFSFSKYGKSHCMNMNKNKIEKVPNIIAIFMAGLKIVSGKNGARYFKGSYLKSPSTEFIPVDTLKKHFRNECQQFISTEIKLLEQKYSELKSLEKAIITIVEHAKPHSDDSEKLMVLARKLEEYAFRFYICNEEGFQTSPNIKKKDDGWKPNTFGEI